MRCKEVIRRINEAVAPDREMIEHINSCPSCARAAEAGRIITDALKNERENNNDVSTPFLEIRNKVMKQAAEKKKENVMSTVKNHLQRRPKLLAGLSLGVIAFLFVTLVPFSYTTTVGYELTYSGLNDDINISPTQLNEALKAIGYDDLLIKMINGRCIIGGLPSHRAAREASVAFTALSGYGGDFRITPIIGVVSGSLYAQVINKYEIEVETDGKTDAEIAEEVRQQLLAKGFDNVDVTVSSSGDGGQIDIHVSGEYTGEDGETMSEIKLQLIGDDSGDISFDAPDPKMKFEFDTENMTNEELKAAIEAKLAAEGKEGAEVEVTTNADGRQEIRVEIKKEKTVGP